MATNMKKEAKSKESPVSSTTAFAVSEAYKTIRTNLILKLNDNKPCHVITITSALAKEGKSTSSINLAVAISQANKKVLLVDGDLRRKMASVYMKHNEKHGLTDLMNGEIKPEDAIINTTYKNFDILPAGNDVNNPSEILGSAEFNALLDDFKEKYDFIIVDTPPVNVVSDALPVIKNSDGVVLVARELAITNKDFKKLLTTLEMIEANIIGIIYIGTDSTQPYYHTHTYYGKHYYKNYNKYSRYE